MGRPKGGTNTVHSKEEKLSSVKRNLNGESLLSLEKETGINNSQIYKRTKQYLDGAKMRLLTSESQVIIWQNIIAKKN